MSPSDHLQKCGCEYLVWMSSSLQHIINVRTVVLYFRDLVYRIVGHLHHRRTESSVFYLAVVYVLLNSFTVSANLRYTNEDAGTGVKY
jgi:hypothetical protein